VRDIDWNELEVERLRSRCSVVNSAVIVNGPVSRSGEAWLRSQSAKCREHLKLLLRQTHLITLILRHPDVPWYSKLIAASTLGYLVSPIQLIPTFIPVIGQLDDVAVVIVGIKLLRILSPKAALTECEAKLHATTAKTQERKGNTRGLTTPARLPIHSVILHSMYMDKS